jgi:hypothetical protein
VIGRTHMDRDRSAPVGHSSGEVHPTTSVAASDGPSRRNLIVTAAAAGASIAFGDRPGVTAEPETRFEFTKPLAGWEILTGQWAIEGVPGAAQGKALVQRASNNAFNVIVAPGGPYTSMDVSVRFNRSRGAKTHPEASSFDLPTAAII